MIWFMVLVVIAAQAGALLTWGRALHESYMWRPNKTKSNQMIFATVVLSAVALMTAYRIGVAMAGC